MKKLSYLTFGLMMFSLLSLSSCKDKIDDLVETCTNDFNCDGVKICVNTTDTWYTYDGTEYDSMDDAYDAAGCN